MRFTKTMVFVAIAVFLFGSYAHGQSLPYCNSTGIVYTSCFPWISTDGTISVNFNGTSVTKNNDGPRIYRAIHANVWKVIFNEPEYYITAPIVVETLRMLEGTGKSPFIAGPGASQHLSSKIIQVTDNTPIFKIGTNVYDVAIRDMALVAFRSGCSSPCSADATGVTGILATNDGATGNDSSIGFDFYDLEFANLEEGVHVDATSNGGSTTVGEWQFDHVKLEHGSFLNCNTGIHINSYNSGWQIGSLDFIVPPGTAIDDPSPPPSPTYTYGIRLERSAYTSMDTLIGNGTDPANPASALIYVQQHAGNLSIVNSIAERFHEDIDIDESTGSGRNGPITLMNNTFMNGLRVKNANLFSSANQYAALNNHGTPVTARTGSQIFSVADKFCKEGDSLCDEGRGFTVEPGAKIIFSSNQAKNQTQVPSLFEDYLSISRDSYYPNTTPSLSIIAPNYAFAPLFRLGRGPYYYDVTRSEFTGDGHLEFTGSQSGYGGYTFSTQGGTARINYDGSVTYGSVNYANLGGATHGSDNGTVVYCPDCQQTNPCSAGGGGAMAKRIAGAWNCN